MAGQEVVRWDNATLREGETRSSIDWLAVLTVLGAGAGTTVQKTKLVFEKDTKGMMYMYTG